jgi:hypothetical protein
MSSTPPVPRLKKMVEYILDENPKYNGIEARNSDIALMILIWQRWYSVGTNSDSIVHLQRLFDLPRQDNVKRARALFQNVEHKYLPTNLETLRYRRIEQAYWEEALGYKLTADEIAMHKQTAKETKAYIYFDEAIDLTDEQLASIAPVHTSTAKAIYLPKTYGSSSLRQNQEYEIEIERLEVGKPIKMLSPIEAVYPSQQSFGKTWRVV